MNTGLGIQFDNNNSTNTSNNKPKNLIDDFSEIFGQSSTNTNSNTGTQGTTGNLNLFGGIDLTNLGGVSGNSNVITSNNTQTNANDLLSSLGAVR